MRKNIPIQKLHLLTKKVIAIQEEERKRLAAEVHDTVAQVLSGISYKLQSCRELVEKEPELVTHQLDGLLEIVRQGMDQFRNLMSGLRPNFIDGCGLVPALKQVAKNFERETGTTVKVHLPRSLFIPEELSICLFRIFQEALTNIYKHAKATEVEVILRKNVGNIHLMINDNGRGFDQSKIRQTLKKTRLGLLIMKERTEALGGTFVVNSQVRKGCRIEVKIPFHFKESKHG